VTPIAFRLQRGQATTEFVVVALALVPLFLLVVLVGKTVDLVHATEAASRYAAFETVVHHSGSGWTNDDALAADVRRRFFSHPDAPVKTHDVAGDFPAHRNPLWSDPTGRPLLPRLDDAVGVATAVDRLDALPAASFAGALALPSDNLATASVTVTPAGVPGLPPFDTMRLRITRRTALLADPWTARHPGAVRERIESAPPLYPVAPVRGLIDAAGRLPTLVFDPALQVGEFDWDVVPCDRLVGGC
jgi:hypothetical protein